MKDNSHLCIKYFTPTLMGVNSPMNLYSHMQCENQACYKITCFELLLPPTKNHVSTKRKIIIR